MPTITEKSRKRLPVGEWGNSLPVTVSRSFTAVALEPLFPAATRVMKILSTVLRYCQGLEVRRHKDQLHFMSALFIASRTAIRSACCITGDEHMGATVKVNVTHRKSVQKE